LAGTGQEDTEKKINGLIKDIQRSTFEGIGKPESLKGNLSGIRELYLNRTLLCPKQVLLYLSINLTIIPSFESEYHGVCL